ncbi:MAG: beta-lactamase family protein, partial [Gemmatimonadetes bacterium]|nr:beta-lactamase family protein [Gemmatimonadota bacterium]NIR37091.1 beta-lactamase family protein [Actinomycetota bacterium]NIS31512.1 beta-lactamase family protein [Actinomycetota bacterium]NIU66626.1 beta-lactamase family protein [Actinomycetota bacterium]NIW28434.1 serine hydrolase [Actinomycetota bacterium]
IRVTSQPGERVYSGGGYLIAQMAIEDRTGERFEDLVDRLVLAPLGMTSSTMDLLWPEGRPAVAVGYRADGSEVAGGGWHQYPETAAGSLWTTAADYALFVIDVMRSYETGDGVVLDRDTARLLLDPDFAVGFGISLEQGGIAIGHRGANEGYRSEFIGLPRIGDGV